MPFDRDPTSASPDLEDIVDLNDVIAAPGDLELSWSDCEDIKSALVFWASSNMDNPKRRDRLCGLIDRFERHIEGAEEEALERSREDGFPRRVSFSQEHDRS